MSKLSGKIAIVSGGNGALGKVVVEQLLLDDAVVITTLSKNSSSHSYLSEKQRQHQSIEGIVVDVTSESSVKKFYSNVIARYSKIDILCNLVGGIGQRKFIEEVSFEEWNTAMNINLHSCFLMMRESIASMKKKWIWKNY